MFICRLADKAYRNNHRIYIHCKDKQQSHGLDDLLWTYKDESFIPHNLIGEGPTPPPPIQLGFEQPPNHRDIIILVNDDIPEFCLQFSRIIEVIPDEPHLREAARERYRYYRQQGCNIKSHDLISKTTT